MFARFIAACGALLFGFLAVTDAIAFGYTAWFTWGQAIFSTAPVFSHSLTVEAFGLTMSATQGLVFFAVTCVITALLATKCAFLTFQRHAAASGADTSSSEL